MRQDKDKEKNPSVLDDMNPVLRNILKIRSWVFDDDEFSLGYSDDKTLVVTGSDPPR